MSKKKLTKAERKREWIAALCVVAVCAAFLGIAALTQCILIPGSHYLKGNRLKKTEDYTAAIEEYKEAGDFRDSSEQIEECKELLKEQNYQKAIALIDSGEYTEAMDILSGLEGYASADVYYKQAQYQRGLKKLSDGMYEEARADFEAVGDFEDAADKACEASFKQAEELYANGNEKEAYELLLTIPEYEGAAELMDKAETGYRIGLIKEAEVGDTVVFGSYEQDNDSADGAESVEWIVLAKEEGKVLLLSRNVLDCVKMHTVRPYNQTVWADTTLRSWCNSTFINTCFTALQQSYILETTVSATTNSYSGLVCGESVDKVFLLSVEEAKEYLPTEQERMAQPTAYAEAEGAYAFYGSETSFWWLRTRGASNVAYAYYSYVNESGFIDSQRGIVYDYVNAGVRPAIWVDISK